VIAPVLLAAADMPDPSTFTALGGPLGAFAFIAACLGYAAREWKTARALGRDLAQKEAAALKLENERLRTEGSTETEELRQQLRDVEERLTHEIRELREQRQVDATRSDDQLREMQERHRQELRSKDLQHAAETDSLRAQILNATGQNFVLAKQIRELGGTPHQTGVIATDHI